MLLTNLSGTVGGATTTGVSAAALAVLHVSTVTDIAIICTGTVGAVTAIISLVRGWKHDPNKQLAAYEERAEIRFNAIEDHLAREAGRTDTLMAHFLGIAELPPEQPHEPEEHHQ